MIALGLLMLAAVAGGWVAGRIGLPPLLGMLLAGLALRNLPGELIESLPSGWSVTLRLIALTVILLRAGMGLNLGALRRLRMPFLRLAFLPNLAEATTIALLARVLADMPWRWGYLLGFVVAAVSPAVVVPSLLDLQERGYGVRKGIPTMVLAAASFDDVLSITGFGLMLSMIFGGASSLDGGIGATLLRAPLELGGGLAVGILAGLIIGRLRSGATPARFGALLGLGLAAVFGGWALAFAGGGSLAAMTMGAVAARQWGHDTSAVAKPMAHLWSVAQPLLFGLIGASVLLSVVETSYVTIGLIMLATGVVVRLGVSYAAVAGAGFNESERRFVALAWLPKATVQAAIGALALDLANETSAGGIVIDHGNRVLTVAVLAIIVTAPLGALGIAWAGPRWLDASRS